MPTKYSSLCSEYFKLEDYQIRPLATVKLLKTDAFPSIFKAFPSHLQKTIPVKRRKLDRIMVRINYTYYLSTFTNITNQYVMMYFYFRQMMLM